MHDYYLLHCIKLLIDGITMFKSKYTKCIFLQNYGLLNCNSVCPGCIYEVKFYENLYHVRWTLEREREELLQEIVIMNTFSQENYLVLVY